MLGSMLGMMGRTGAVAMLPRTCRSCVSRRPRHSLIPSSRTCPAQDAAEGEGRHPLRTLHLVPLLWIGLATSAFAQEAPPLEINQTCAIETGCFPGDDPGFPVTIAEPGDYVLTSNLRSGGATSEGLWSIDSTSPATTIDLQGFSVAWSGDGSPSNGIRGVSTVRNGSIGNVFDGVGNAHLVEDMSINSRRSAIGGVQEVRRVSINGALNGISCTQCFIQDVYLGIDGAIAIHGDEGFMERVTTSPYSVVELTGAARIVDSEIGHFDLGNDSSISNSTAHCGYVYPFTESSAGDNFSLISSALIAVGNLCDVDFGESARMEDSSIFGRLDTGSNAVLWRNSLILEGGSITVGANSVVEGNSITVGSDQGGSGSAVSVGANSLVKGNLLDGSGSSRIAIALAAGSRSRAVHNTIQNFPNGITCDLNCIVAKNTITDYSGTGVGLGSTSYYFGNDIDESGVAKISGGINLDPSAISLSSPTAALNTNAPEDAGSDIFPQLATDGVGQWLAIWQSSDDLSGTIGTDMDILLVRSSDDGATWTDPVVLNKTGETDTTDDVEPVIVTDANGNWVAAWSSTEDINGTVGGDRDILFSRSADEGATWTNVGALNTNANTDSGSDERPHITTNGGIFLAAWQSNDSPTGPDYDIWVAQSFTGGASWASPILLNSTGWSDSSDDSHPVLATDSAGNWLAVWESNDASLGGDGDLMVARSTDDGATWTAPSPLNQNAPTDTGFDARPTIKTDSAGTWLVVWESNEDLGGNIGQDLDLVFVRSIDNGITWTAPQPLNNNANSDLGDDANPSLIADSVDVWTVVWDSSENLAATTGEDVDIFYSRSADDGITWSAPALLNSNGSGDVGNDRNPKIAKSASGDRAVVVWHSDEDLAGSAGLDWDIFRARIAPPKFRGLGDLTGGDFSSRASDTSFDGSVVTGWSHSASGEPWEAFRWTANTGMVPLGDLPGGSYASTASGISADGHVIVGSSHSAAGEPWEAYRWTQNSGLIGLGDLTAGPFYSAGVATSADGAVVVGCASSDAQCGDAYRWTQDTGMVDLGFQTAADVSADGAVVVGQTSSDIVRWALDSGIEVLGPGYSQAVSADGEFVVGKSGDEAFIWSRDRSFLALGDLPGGPVDSVARDVSADGSVIVGVGASALGDEAFIWTAAGGMHNLKAVLANHLGLGVDGWTLTEAVAISGDGQTIVGHGTNPDGFIEAWAASLSGLVPALDADHDGVVNFKDNCLNDSNPAQDDLDQDDIGDACDVFPDEPCNFAGALPPSTSALAAFQNNSCEDWSGVFQITNSIQSTILTKADLSSSNLSGTIFINSALRGANLESAVLVNSRLENTDLNSAILRFSDLSFANLTGANLVNADLTSATVSSTVFTGVEYNENAIFPSGNTYDLPPWGLDGDISPWNAGMIPVPEPAVKLLLTFGIFAVASLVAWKGVG